MSFQISDRVVCVDASGLTVADFLPLPVNGCVYVVRDIDPPTADSPAVGLFLVGIEGEMTPNGEASLVSSRFRKLTDIQEENRARAYYGASYKEVRP